MVVLVLIDELSPLAGGHDALDLIQAAIGAGRAILYHVTSDLAGTAAAACLGGSSLDRAVMSGQASRRGLAFPRISRLGHCRGGTTHDDEDEDRGRVEDIRCSDAHEGID